MARMTTLGGLNLLRMGGVHFDVDVSLAGGAVRPLDPGERDTGGVASFEPGAEFEITVEKAYAGGDYSLDNVAIRVFVGDERVHEETHDSGSLARLGTHTWRWDGFSKGKFSSWRDAGKKVQVMAIARHYPLATGDYGALDLEVEKAGPAWFDVDIDTHNHTIDVWLRVGLSFVTGGARQHADHLKALFSQGLKKYWGRAKADGPTIDGSTYAVEIHPDLLAQTDSDTIDFDIHRTNAADYMRSHNFGIIDGQIYYNAGAFSTLADADDRFEYTSAHEFGHTVLEEAGGKDFSWTHKGSTTLYQTNHDGTPTYPPSPSPIDMMLYFSDSEPPDFYSRVHATNDDILRLISMGRIKLS